MRVFDSKTQQLTPEWLAKSRLVKDLKLGDVLSTGSGPARVVGLAYMITGHIQINLEFMHVDPDDGGAGTWAVSPENRVELQNARS